MKLRKKSVKFKCDECKTSSIKVYSQFQKSKNHFCSVRCHWRFRSKMSEVISACTYCGKERIVPRHQTRPRYKHRRKFCSRKCYDKSRQNTGSGTITKGGYREIRRNGKPVMEHRWIWEQHNGSIPVDATIHHKNGNRLDNRIENLELWEGRHCKGQRSSDLDDDAVQRLIEKGWLVIRPEHVLESIR